MNVNWYQIIKSKRVFGDEQGTERIGRRRSESKRMKDYEFGIVGGGGGCS
jgi:hypothetical protein